MPTNRFQFSDDFVLNANKVGINSSTPQEELDVVGIVKGDNLKLLESHHSQVMKDFSTLIIILPRTLLLHQAQVVLYLVRLLLELV
jgi:hypothetical protein